MARMPKNVKSI